MAKAKLPATFVPTYVKTLVDYVRDRNYGMAEYVAADLLGKIDDIDWRDFATWRKLDTCTWTWDGEKWDTACDEAFIFETGGPVENGMKYCAYCGRRLKQDG